MKTRGRCQQEDQQRRHHRPRSRAVGHGRRPPRLDGCRRVQARRARPHLPEVHFGRLRGAPRGGAGRVGGGSRGGPRRVHRREHLLGTAGSPLGTPQGPGEKKGGEFYTPRSVVKLLVEMLEPYRGPGLRSVLRLLGHVRAVDRVHSRPRRAATATVATGPAISRSTARSRTTRRGGSRR